MKFTATILFILLIFFTQNINAQLVAEDQAECIQTEDTWVPQGMVGTRNTYYSQLGNGEVPCRVTWSIANNRWEIIAAVEADGIFNDLLHYNNFASRPKPPSLTTGTWTESGIGCGPLIAFSGPYTQNFLVLPVTLINFTGQFENQNINLLWMTTFEEDHAHFIVEHADNSYDFREIGTVTSNSSTTGVKNYAFTHKNSVNGTNYYRLKQVDFNGNHSYSGIISLEKNRNITAQTIFPNPAKTIINISENTSYEIFDLSGNKVAVGHSKDGIVNVENLQNGIYLISLADLSGVTNLKFVKQ